jgi:pentatricopeptide repeat protein
MMPAMNTASDRLAAAARLVNARRFREAEEIFRDMLQRDSSDPDALCGLASLALMRGAASEAFEILSHARVRHPTHSGILGTLASAHHVLDRPGDAMDCIDAAIAVTPLVPALRVSRMQFLLAANRQADALAEIDAALAIDPGQTDLLNAKGTVLMALGRAREGADHFGRAHAADSNQPQPAYNLSMALAALGHDGDAVGFAERAYLNEPGDPSYRVNFARRLLAVGRVGEARAAAQAAAAIAPADVEAHEIHAACLVYDGETDNGLAQLANLVRQSRSSPESCLALARILGLAGRHAQALAAVTHALRVAPDDPVARTLERRFTLALGHFSPGEFTPDRAATVFATAGASLAEVVFFSRWLRPGSTLYCALHEAALLEGLDEVEVLPGDTGDHPSILSLIEAARFGPPHWVPFLRVRESRIAPWRKAVKDLGRPRIGIMWGRGPDSIGLAAIELALAPSGGVLVSLAAGDMREALPDHPAILDGGVHIHDAAGLAAAIMALDAVVTSDPTVAHIAGALGKPGILLGAAGRPWHWLAGDGRSIWYPTIEIIEQTDAGSWSSVLAVLPSRIEALAPHWIEYRELTA